MLNIYSMLKQHVDRKPKNKADDRSAERLDVPNKNPAQEFLLHYLSELERVTPQSTQKQFYQLLAKLNG